MELPQAVSRMSVQHTQETHHASCVSWGCWRAATSTGWLLGYWYWCSYMPYQWYSFDWSSIHLEVHYCCLGPYLIYIVCNFFNQRIQSTGDVLMDLTGRNISDYLVKTYPILIRTRYTILKLWWNVNLSLVSNLTIFQTMSSTENVIVIAVSFR